MALEQHLWILKLRSSDKFLADAKIAKGKMTLVDEARQKELLNVLNSKHYCLVKNVVDQFVIQ